MARLLQFDLFGFLSPVINCAALRYRVSCCGKDEKPDPIEQDDIVLTRDLHRNTV